MTTPTLTPRLVVRSSADAIDFYAHAFGAEELERFTTPDGVVVHAAIRIGDAVVALADRSDDNQSPDDLGGSTVILTLIVDDPDAVAARAVERGARIVFPIEDQFYGHREGRIRDPFGHLWIVSKIIEELDAETIQKRTEGWAGD
ncbi:MAG: VOC family protein [Sandaracinaceae bacterium]